jgi:hypothetical protein
VQPPATTTDPVSAWLRTARAAIGVDTAVPVTGDVLLPVRLARALRTDHDQEGWDYLVDGSDVVSDPFCVVRRRAGCRVALAPRAPIRRWIAR